MVGYNKLFDMVSNVVISKGHDMIMFLVSGGRPKMMIVGVEHILVV